MLPQSTPALLSLKVRRTAEEIIAMNTNEAGTVASQALSQPKAADETLSHADEIRNVHLLVEQQCFAFVASLNTIHDARKMQNEAQQRFQAHAKSIEERLHRLSDELLKKVKEMNHQIDLISHTLAPKPIFRRMSAPNEFGRVTGICVLGDVVGVTTASGFVVILSHDSFAVVAAFQPFPAASLFHPTFIVRPNGTSLLTIASNRKLLLSSPYRQAPDELLDAVECFEATEEQGTRTGFDIVTGHPQMATFYALEGGMRAVGQTKNLRGTVTQIVIDSVQLAVFVLTSRRTFYSISATTFQIILSMQFSSPLMQLSMTGLLLVISCAPNNILMIERIREKYKEVGRFTIERGLRRFWCSQKSIIIITKDQKVERRNLCQPMEIDIICEPETADYDPLEYIGSVTTVRQEIYLSHGNRISFWS
jgi:hypothetical protein